MDLNPTPEQQAIAEAVRRWTREQVTPAQLREWDLLTGGIDPRSWQRCAHLGWFGLAVPTKYGGSGLSLLEIATWFQEAARGLVPLPVMQAVRGAHALATLAPDAPELAGAATGEVVVAIATCEPGTDDPDHWSTTLEHAEQGFRLFGEKTFVSNAPLATYHLVGARSPKGLSWCLVASTATNCTEVRTFDGDRQAHVCYRNAPVARVLVSGSEARKRWRRLQLEAQALALAEMIGIMDAVLERTVAYVKEREQFGQKIGVFQAVQHQIADMATAFTASRHLAWQAVARLHAGTYEGWELDVARVFVPQACKRLTLTAHHLHGGAGYVLEHPLHYYSERAVTLCVRYGLERQALETVAQQWLDS
ncbi:MAG: acyl-CoA/acyl-ACP dehydrogenase [candidate division KSB1 bacterium]|nr:acyl-CoA/acyl-ACP dehydrogenase [candidate division KSB1 bacterium]